MSAVWEVVFACAREVSPVDALRVANLAIAGAAKHALSTKRRTPWDASKTKESVSELALFPLSSMSEDTRLWSRLAEAAVGATHLGLSPDAMHSWAAAFQRASTTQKALGAYATHDAFAAALARITLEPFGGERVSRIVDPSVGAGNLLLAAIEKFGRHRTDGHLKKFILSLYGVELDGRARELCCLLLWLSGAASGVTLDQVASNIRVGNALTFDWWAEFDQFDALLMNPPWESLRHKVEQDDSGERAATVARLSIESPGAPGLPGLFTAQGTGDRNLFKAFVELAPHLLRDGGRLGALLPAAFASDAGLTELRERYLSQFEIARWTSYENRGGYFPIDSRYKFGLLAATRSNIGTKKLLVRGFAIEPDEVDAPHIALNRADIALIGRKYHIIPELFQQRELDILRTALSNGTPLFSVGSLGQVAYRREIDLSLGKAQFHHVATLQLHNRGDATYVSPDGREYVPLMEGRSVGPYDCFQKSWVSGSGRTAAWRENGLASLSDCQPQYVIAPLCEERQLSIVPSSASTSRVALCDVTAATNTRTVIASWVPRTWRCGNTAPVLEFESDRLALAGLGVLNSMVFDWIARRLCSGLHLNKFILEGLVWPSLSDEEVDRLAEAALVICLSKPRSGIAEMELSSLQSLRQPRLKTAASDPLDAEAAIEQLVARGLGLSAGQMRAIYDDGRSDRRGFWRHFDATPSAKVVAARALDWTEARK